MSRALAELRVAAGLAAGVALAWVLLFHLNARLFASLEVSRYVSWVFLPAALRMVAVLWLGWAGALGLFAGALLTNLDLLQTEPAAAIVLSALSSLPSLLAATALAAWLRLPADLAGLRPRHLLAFGLGGAAASVAAHTLYFIVRAGDGSAAANALPMFVGDAVGTVLMLSGLRLLLGRRRG